MLKSGRVAAAAPSFRSLRRLGSNVFTVMSMFPLLFELMDTVISPTVSAAENAFQIDELGRCHHRDDDENDGEDACGGCSRFEGVA
ncbi:hypothetical protein D3C71_1299030 [compost metagenome]